MRVYPFRIVAYSSRRKQIGILFLNAFVGWYQEKQAGDIVAQLKAGIALKATVIRMGQEVEIEAREVVIGDIVIIEEATTIPADCRIISSYDVRDNPDVYKRLEEIDKLKKSKKGQDDDDEDQDSEEGKRVKDLKGSSVGAVDQS